MTRILVWDIPARLFHWILAGSFLGAFAIATLLSDHSPYYAVHMLLGAVVVFIILLRVVWGMVGSRHARFGSFIFAPSEILAYFKGIISGRGKHYVGHNPGSSVAIFAMLFLLVALGASGALISQAEVFEDLHEIIAWTTLAVVGVHVAGVLVHTVLKKENITLSMINGHKEAGAETAIPSARPIAGVIFLVLTGLWAGGLYAGYDAANQQVTLPLIGKTMQLGEGEEHDKTKDDKKKHDKKKDDDD